MKRPMNGLLALLLARVREVNVTGMSAREALEIATLGGAKALGREDIGHLAPGMSADFIACDTQKKPWVGTHADPVAALLLCQTDSVEYSFVNGRKIVDRGCSPPSTTTRWRRELARPPSSCRRDETSCRK